MDDLIVVILTLVVAGFGLLGQLKKKKQASAGNNTPKTTESFWDIIQGGAGNQENLVESEYDEPEFEHKPEPVKQQFEAGVEKSKYQDPANVGGRSVLKNDETLKTTKPKLNSKIKTEFSLRKAVIYSEILNRKYT